MDPYFLPLLLILLGCVAMLAGALLRLRAATFILTGIALLLWAPGLYLYNDVAAQHADEAAAIAAQPPAQEAPAVVEVTERDLARPIEEFPLELQGRIVFHSERSGNLDIWAMNADGSDPEQLTDIEERDIEPAWSPDGAQIAFASARDAEHLLAIYLMDADGGNQRSLVSTPEASNWTPAWSPDGQRIAFQSNRDRHAMDDGRIRVSQEVYVINVDGSDERNLTNSPNSNDTTPAWSPDGSMIAFTSDRTGSEQVFVMDADGGNVEQLTDALGRSRSPKWSPDGQQLVFESNRDGRWSIYVMPAPGSPDFGAEPTRLTSPIFDDNGPVWALDGQAIVFSSDREDRDWEIYMMTADAEHLVRLTHSPGLDRFPDWTP